MYVIRLNADPTRFKGHGERFGSLAQAKVYALREHAERHAQAGTSHAWEIKHLIPRRELAI